MGADGANGLRAAMGNNTMGAMLGGKRKSRRSRSRARSASKSRRARRAGSSYKKAKKGGMGFGAVVKEALVPFGLFALQKRTHRRRTASKGRKLRRTRRR